MYSQYNSDVLKFDDLPDPTEQWELVERIGEGTYGEVHIAKHLHTGDVIAVKIMESIHEVVEEIEVEYRVLKELCGHPNLPTFHGIYLKQDPKTEDQIWLGMELCAGGSVTDVVKAQVKNGHQLEELIIAHILKETMKALNHLHKNHVMHRDIKGHNILFTSDARVKLIDFGVSGHLKSSLGRRNTSVGTPFWMAPEVIACEQQMEYDYDIRCDIWSLGVTAIELAEGEPPLADLHPMRALFRVPRDPPPTLKSPAIWSDSFKDFVSKCCIKDFEQRPLTEDLFEHPFIKQVQDSDTEKLRTKLVELIQEAGTVIHEPYVTTKHGRLRSKRKSKREPISAVDDLATLDVLEENIIVQHLLNRYNQEKIYTYIGDILLAVNPFTPLTIYSDEYSKHYRNAGKRDNPPHIFAIADQSYQAMMHHKHNQCIVISGESGSGKTESANLMVQQLTLLGRAPNRTLEDKILQVNPLVEAFGNAKTVINDNSSRFGKYLEMTFTANGKVTGARLSEYLLEKSRVVSQGVGEKNFHIMYYVHDGLNCEGGKQTKFHLNDKDGYRYLNGHTCEDVSATSINRVKFKAIQNCFEIIGFKSQEINSVCSILAGILHVGNVRFEEKESKHQNQTSQVSNMELLKTVSELLGIDGKELSEALTTSGMVARGETIIRYNTVEESVNVRDAMAKAMYGRLFSWIVNKINQLLKPSRAKSHDDETFTVGILDIFGFENFERNSFEQLCINIANEQIQYYFNQHIFAWEQQEYTNEGIDASQVNYVDNRPVLDMFLTKPMGVLALLDEESNFPKSTDFTLVEKFNQNIHSNHFEKPKSSGLTFIIYHYAGKVVYIADGILEKNRDRLAPELVNVLRLSQIAMVRSLFHNPLTKTGNLAYSTLGSNASSIVSSPSSSASSGLSIRSASKTSSASKNRSQQTMATYFRYSLMDLLSKMVAGTPLFVRCIRPNVENLPGLFDTEKVLIQLRYTGVLETTRIRRQGYSHRIPFSEFLKRYYILGFNWHEKVRVNKESCKILLEKLGLENWALGKTKVFLKYYHIEQLSRKFEEYNSKLVLTQAVLRTFLQKRRYQRLKEESTKSAIIIQRHTRGHLARRKHIPVINKRHDAVVCIQRRTRGFQQRKRYMSERDLKVKSAVKIQSVYRGYHVRNHLKVEQAKHDEVIEHAVLVLQKSFRMWHCQSRYLQMQMEKLQTDGRTDTQSAEQIDGSNNAVAKTLNRVNNAVIVEETEDELTSSTPLSPAATTTLPLRSISKERLQQMERINNVKTPWTPEDEAYYDKLNKENRTRAMRGRLKALTSPEGQAYYNKIMADFNPSKTEENKTQAGWDEALNKTRNRILASSTSSSSTANNSNSNTASDMAERGSLIEADDKADMNDVLQEQKEQREAMLLNLEIQRKNSLSAKFHRWKRLLEQQEQREKRWENLVDQARQQSSGQAPQRGSGWAKIASNTNNTNTSTDKRLKSVVVKEMVHQSSQEEKSETNTDNKQQADAQKTSQLRSQSVDNIVEANNNNSVINENDESHGKFNFRAALRKVRNDPTKTLRRSPEEVASSQVDFRHVLKKKVPSQEELRLKRHVIVNQ